MRNTEYKVIIEEIRQMREEIGRIDRDLSRDRHDLEDFKIQMAEMKEQVKQLREEVSANSDRIKDSVRDVLKPAVKEVNKLKQAIRKKKVLTIQPDNFTAFILNLKKRIWND